MNDKTKKLLQLASELAEVDPNDSEKLEELLKKVEASEDAFQPEVETPEPEIFAIFRDPKTPLTTLNASPTIDLAVLHNGQNLLFPAIESDELERVTWLIEQGLNVNQQSKHQYTPLMHAINTRFERMDEIVKLFLDKGADFTLGSQYSETPFRLSMRYGDFKTALLLIERGLDWRTVGFSPLHQAAARGDLAQIRALATPETIEARSTWAQTPWLTAIAANQPAAAASLEELGCQTDVRGHPDASALFIAAASNAALSIQHLLKRGHDIEIKTDFGDTPLHEASSFGSLEAARTLLTHGARCTVKNSVGSQPINVAQKVEMLALLHQYGADLNHVDGCGEWPLHSAANDDDLERMQWLIANGADPNTTSTGEISLHKAARWGSLQSFLFLIEAGSDIDTQDVDGDSALFQCNAVEKAKILVERGTDRSLQDCCGNTAAEASHINPQVRAYLASLA